LKSLKRRMPAKAKTKRSAPRKTKATELDLHAASKAVDFADKLTVPELVSSVGTLQASVQGSLATLVADLTAKLDESRQLDLAIEEKRRRIQELTGVEGAAVTLDELNIKIEETRETWTREQEERELKWDDENTLHMQTWERLKASSRYEFEQQGARQTATHEATVAEHQRQEKIRQDDLQRDWTDRENKLKEQENEVTQLRQQVADFPKQQSDAVAKATAETEARLKTTYEHRISMIERDSKSAVDMAQQQLKAAQQQLLEARADIKTLEDRATMAEGRTLEVMRNALSVDAERRRADSIAQTASASSGKSNK
jgi:hypothetical protein